MGRRKIEIKRIEDDRIRRVTFKKRRIGLLKKAIQISKLTDAIVELKIYHEEDQSLVEYFSTKETEETGMRTRTVDEFSKFYNNHYNLVARLEERVATHGLQSANILSEVELKMAKTENVNISQLFSLAKKSNIKAKMNVVPSYLKVKG